MILSNNKEKYIATFKTKPQKVYQGKSKMDTLNTCTASINSNSKKVATHSHIKGLGLKEDGTAEPISSGFVSQFKAREVNYSIYFILILMF